MVVGVAALIATPVQSVLALNATEVGAIAKTVTVRIESQNLGSGVIIKRQANVYTVLTAAHVVEIEDEYSVITPDGQRHSLEYSKIKKLPQVDLALVEFTSANAYKVAKMGDSTAVRAGEVIYVSGFPLPTLAITESIWNFSDGRVKANSQRPLADGYALIYSNDTLPGMSGGAVLNSQGQLIAIHGRADAEQTIQKTEVVYQKTGFNLGIPINTFLNLAATVSPHLGFTGKVTDRQDTALTADDWLLQAVGKYKQGKFQDAIQDFDQAITLNPQFAEAYNGRGFMYHWLQQPSKALQDYNRAIALNPQLAEAYNGRGFTYHWLKQYPKALQDYNQSIALNPKFVEAYINRGRTYLHLRQYPQTLQDYDQAIALNPKLPGTYTARGFVYHRLKQYPQALQDYQQAIAIDPKFAQAFHLRGFTYYGLKQYSQALKDYGQAIALNPEFAQAYYNRGQTYFQLERYPQTLQDYDQAITLNPKLAQAYNGRGLTYHRLQQYPKALQDYDQAIVLNPQFAAAHHNRGQTYTAIGDSTRAKQDFQQAAQLFLRQNNLRRHRKSIQRLKDL